jgi:hypothetical protein
VIAINLTSNNLQGALPPELALLAPAQRDSPFGEGSDGRDDGGLRNIFGGGGGGRDGGGGSFRPPPPPRDGEFGAQIPNITKGLFSVDFSRNNLTGELPSRIGDCNNMEVFLVHDNQLSGPIPDISNWTASLEEASFLGNNFVGEIPLEFCSADSFERQISVDCDTISCDCCNPSCNYNSTAI